MTAKAVSVESLVWVLLENNIWWPGIVENQRNPILNGRALSSLRIVSLFGTKERIIVDLSNSEGILQYNSSTELDFFSAYTEQSIPDELRLIFVEAVDSFNEYAPKVDSLSQISPHPPNSNSSMTVSKSLKRKDALTWDDYFIAVAFLSAMRSKDPSTQVGACIVNSRNRIVGIGYNGFPRGCSDDILPWARSAADELDTKYPYVCHAEVNAILNKNSADLDQCTLYVALFPCNECAKMIIQSGITRVIYLSDKYHHTNSMRASRRMFELAGVTILLRTPIILS